MTTADIGIVLGESKLSMKIESHEYAMMGCHASAMGNISCSFRGVSITPEDKKRFNSNEWGLDQQTVMEAVYNDDTQYHKAWLKFAKAFKGYGMYLFTAPINDLSRSNLFGTYGFAEWIRIAEYGTLTCSHIIENTSSGHKGDSIDQAWVWSPPGQNVLPNSHFIMAKYKTPKEWIKEYKDCASTTCKADLTGPVFKDRIEQHSRRMRLIKNLLSEELS